jgi:HlyD family secretion protein
VRASVAFVGRVPSGLRQNQRVPTRLIREPRRDVLRAPRGPFLEAGGGRSVYVVEGETAVLREIRVGATSVGVVEIVAGLEPGDEIIVSDTTRFGNAERVFLRE